MVKLVEMWGWNQDIGISMDHAVEKNTSYMPEIDTGLEKIGNIWVIDSNAFNEKIKPGRWITSKILGPRAMIGKISDFEPRPGMHQIINIQPKYSVDQQNKGVEDVST